MTKKLYTHLLCTVIVLCFCLLLPFTAAAARASFAWDGNDPLVEGYHLYQRTPGLAYNYNSPAWSGSSNSCTIEGLEAGNTYIFVLRAFNDSVESENSNEVSYTPAIAVDANVDSDGDGMPDSWEIQYGLDPAVDDGQGDLDHDGISNEDEYQLGSNPAQGEGAALPAKPGPMLPAQGAIVGLTPTLSAEADAFGGDFQHARTCYQISTTADFSVLVFEKTSAQHLFSLRLSDLILDPETTYYWRVRFIDAQGSPSAWSDTSDFMTVGYDIAGDSDGNGILDYQEPVAQTDLDHNGVIDADQDQMRVVNTSDAKNPQLAVQCNQAGVHIAALQAIELENPSAGSNRPKKLTGLMSFKLDLNAETETAMVSIYFTHPAPLSAQWYKYDPDSGWSPYADALFSEDRRSVSLALQDGGPGDQDGVRNGVIVDPAGLGYSDEAPDSNPESDSTACFIATSVNGPSGDGYGCSLAAFLLLISTLAASLLGGGLLGLFRESEFRGRLSGAAK